MCGLAGVYNLNGKSLPLNQLKKMSDVIGHRGPDGEGYFRKMVALAHKRLAILDLSNRGQPEV